MKEDGGGNTKDPFAEPSSALRESTADEIAERVGIAFSGRVGPLKTTNSPPPVLVTGAGCNPPSSAMPS